MPGPQRLGERVGEIEDARGRAPVVGQRVALSRPGSGIRHDGEVLWEVIDVVNAGTTPLVDGLAWIADGGHGMAIGEHCLEQSPLSHRRVLVFVEQNDRVMGPQLRAHLRRGAHYSQGKSDLVGEVDDLTIHLCRTKLIDESAECCAHPCRVEHLAADLLE